MMLTPHFALDEFIVSQEAARRGIDNTPPAEVVDRLRHTAVGLEGVRIRLGAPIHISSGYRCSELNAAVGGAATSDHLTGDAADFICPGFGSPATIVGCVRVQRLPHLFLCVLSLLKTV